MISRLQIRCIIILLLAAVSISNNFSHALDADNQGAATVSIHEVAQQIRQYKSWQILDASPRKKTTGILYFRFKLLGQGGKVKIINIDPDNPNLRRLE